MLAKLDQALDIFQPLEKVQGLCALFELHGAAAKAPSVLAWLFTLPFSLGGSEGVSASARVRVGVAGVDGERVQSKGVWLGVVGFPSRQTHAFFFFPFLSFSFFFCCCLFCCCFPSFWGVFRITR